MKDNPNLVNVWAQVTLMIIGFAIVAYLVMTNAQKLLNNDVKSTPAITKAEFSNYYTLPLPFGINANLTENKYYKVDQEYQRTYLIKYLNQEIKQEHLTNVVTNEFNDYEIDGLLVNNASIKFFGSNANQLGLDYEPNLDFYIIPQRDLNAVLYKLVKIDRTTNFYILEYEETKKAYLNGDIDNQSVAVITGKYRFYIIVNNKDYRVAGYRYERKNTPPVGYQVAS